MSPQHRGPSEGYLQSLRRRAERALPADTIERMRTTPRTRAIVGPQLDASTDATFQLADEGARRLKAYGTASYEPPTAEQLMALELVIRATRPAPLSRQGKLEGMTPESLQVFPDWPAFQVSSAPLLYSIGRLDVIERMDDPDATRPVGTGFLVAPGLLVTNMHVLTDLSRGTMVLSKGHAVVRFRRELDTAEKERYDVLGVVTADEVLDVALLEVEERAGSPPILFDDRPANEGDVVVVIGYPLEDARNPAFVDALFGNRYGVKRAAPGEVVRLRRTGFFHDCSTLAGNSGSPVLSMNTARLVGVHKEGYFLARNEAARAEFVRDLLAPHLPA